MWISLSHYANIFWSLQGPLLKFLGSHMNLGNLGLYYISKFTQAYKADSYGFSREIFGSVFFYNL